MPIADSGLISHNIERVNINHNDNHTLFSLLYKKHHIYEYMYIYMNMICLTHAFLNNILNELYDAHSL